MSVHNWSIFVAVCLVKCGWKMIISMGAVVQIVAHKSVYVCVRPHLLMTCTVTVLHFVHFLFKEFRIYVPYTGTEQDTPAEIAFLQILSNLIVLNTLVPISLYVRSGLALSPGSSCSWRRDWLGAGLFIITGLIPRPLRNMAWEWG